MDDMGPGRIRKIRFYVYPLHDAFHKWGFDGISQRRTSAFGEIYGKNTMMLPRVKTKFFQILGNEESSINSLVTISIKNAREVDTMMRLTMQTNVEGLFS